MLHLGEILFNSYIENLLNINEQFGEVSNKAYEINLDPAQQLTVRYGYLIVV